MHSAARGQWAPSLDTALSVLWAGSEGGLAGRLERPHPDHECLCDHPKPWDCPVTVILFVTFSLVVSRLIRLGIYLQRLARLHRVESRIDLRGWWWDLGNVSVPSRVYKSTLIPARFSPVQ